MSGFHAIFKKNQQEIHSVSSHPHLESTFYPHHKNKSNIIVPTYAGSVSYSAIDRHVVLHVNLHDNTYHIHQDAVYPLNLVNDVHSPIIITKQNHDIIRYFHSLIIIFQYFTIKCPQLWSLTSRFTCYICYYFTLSFYDILQ